MTNSANDIQSERAKGKRTEAGYCNKFQVRWRCCFRLVGDVVSWLQTRDSLKNYANHCTSYKAEAHLDLLDQR